VAIITIVGIHWQILQEEGFLIGRHGEEYHDYMKRVRRYI
jgi:protein-S-isoprenylcysteine O-methyltransferase Ste14